MQGYKAIIGLEVHAQLLTKSKIFSSDSAAYGADPNTQVSVVSLGHPGTLPVLNQVCVDHALKVGLALGCEITRLNYFARKNYFYADLPKGYQISQDTTPICRNGSVHIRTSDGSGKIIRIHRIHMEEDSGKSIHDQDPYHTLVDLNRAGVGLIEIVSEADLGNAEEAMAYLGEIRKIVRYLGICDGNMEEGSLRCDANISVMKTDAHVWGTKVEVKNMNSISNVGRAINYEIERQIAALEKGEIIRQQTRTWDAGRAITVSMRDKESAHDYRYFPEPDLPSLFITDSMLEGIRMQLPKLPHELYADFTGTLQLPEQDAVILTDNRAFAEYFITLTESGASPKAAANWMLGSVRSWLNAQALPIESYPISPAQLLELIQLVEGNAISNTIARDKLLPLLLENPEAGAENLAKAHNLLMEEAGDELITVIESVLAQFPDKVSAFRGGKTGLSGFFMGQVMQATGGKYDPKIINQKVIELLSQAI
jgi:aspartyl-tRNA(Asn)/glutamyl-tRNA(Gln) amidotransferase subunit B